ncbi:hypothetical protein F7647_10515 [Tenacibaculum piscium]|uniref:hypothetical protein n=1 Tax=Tenacibaculum piscium TaxID=1458515 RepID=UPI00187BA24F|nr:hypothetical protein [Tenacibaculum piscium]MBE7686481.1 hypothetical protein [Tenacibaculum piscium]MBE7691195.1 hypothetical protein [Tenacibaculum piscium]
MKHQENVKKWFEIHDKPSEQQFYNFFKWIRWIDENISVQDIEGLNNLLIAKADKQAFNTHLEDEILHPSENDRANWNGKLDKTGTAVNSLKLGNQLPSYYVAKQDVYNKQESNNALLLAMNEVVQMLLNNPDAEINSIQELLSEMTTADNALVASIANKVSYVVFQNLSEEQQKIAQKNIGLLNHNHDDRYPTKTYLGDNYFNKGYINRNVLSVTNSFNALTAEGVWNNTFGIGIAIKSNTNGSTGFPSENGATVHFHYFGDPLRSFSLWKGTINNNNLWVQFYNEDGTSRGFERILTMETLDKEDIDSLNVDAKTLDGKEASEFSKANHNHDGEYVKLANNFNSSTGAVTHDEDNTSISTAEIINVKDAGYPMSYVGVIHFNVKGRLSEMNSTTLVKQSGFSRWWLRGYRDGSGQDYKEIALLENVQPKQTVAPLSTVTSYTAKASDIGNIVPLNNANTQIILNTASFSRIGDKAQYFYKGIGTCKVATSGSANELKNINDTLEFDGQNSMVEITKISANEYFVCGQLIRA